MNNGMSLYDTIVSKENIYNSIYCLESYVFEKGLLDKDDLEKYVALHDKFDFELIETVIRDCKERLSQILLGEHQLFDVKVYFKVKQFECEKGKEQSIIKYRPIHTASLIDQICMVCMLLPLMYDDSSGVRKKSELTKTIPHDFYGNIPGNEVEALFKPWISQYKSYTEDIIAHCKEYRENHKYKTELTLDIKNFFPSISPVFIFDYVTNKLNITFEAPDDKKMLETVLTKLLIFNIQGDNIKGWENTYYGEKVPDGKKGFFSRGIAQGLPQSYFFGNLCMTEIRKKLFAIDDFKCCDSFFYVDDSVIYIIGEYNNEEHFKETIKNINTAVSTIGNTEDDKTSFEKMSECLSENQYLFQREITCTIEFHDTKKSSYSRIEDAKIGILGLEPLMRNASMASSIFSNTDEVEDIYSEDKLRKIGTLIDDEINRQKSRAATKGNTDADDGTDENDNDNSEPRLKLLKRYKRFYLYRLRLLKRRLSDEISVEDIEDFKNRFKICCISENCKSISSKRRAVERWFETFDEEIFQSEARMLISMLPYCKAKDFLLDLQTFEKELVKGNCGTQNYLYFTRDFSSTLLLKKLECNPYASISKLIRLHMSPIHTLSPIRQKQNFECFVKKLYQCRENYSKKSNIGVLGDYIEHVLRDYTSFIFVNSDEYVRIILNAFYSVQNDIEACDAKIFTKYSSRGLHYTELRILTRLRNKHFVFKNFVRALEDIDANDLDNRMTIDMGLLEVINIFITKVRDPECVDNIVLTHRVVKGLWYNGSKFMNSYTLHNEEHAVTLIKAVIRLVKAIDYLNIKQIDYYVLFLACYLHDISMVIHPNLRNFCNGDTGSLSIISDFIVDVNNILSKNSIVEEDQRASSESSFKEVGHLLIKQFDLIYQYFSNDIRQTHSQHSAQIIREWKDTVLKYLSPLLLSHVAQISESHGYDADEVYGLKSTAKSSLVSSKYSMMLIRLADLMDVANDRINYNLLRQNVSHMERTSQFHWISHLITDELQISPTYKTDDNVNEPIEKRKITEYLNFNLFLNVKYLEATSQLCEKCCFKGPLDINVVSLPTEYAGCEGFMLEMFDNSIGTENNVAGNNKCPVLCRWIVKKHEWLVKELKHLNIYLNAVNDRWFRTEVRLNIIYRDDFPLDKDLYDVVYEYITS